MKRATALAGILALFVLASQNRLAKQSDLRANLDLQIDLLVEREMTRCVGNRFRVCRALVPEPEPEARCERLVGEVISLIGRDRVNDLVPDRWMLESQPDE